MYRNKLLTVAAMAAVLYLQSCSSSEVSAPVAPGRPVTVRVALPVNADGGSNIIASGQVEALQSVNISTRIMGYITKVYVKPGDEIKQGALLFSVSNTDIVARKAQVQAGVEQAQVAYANAKKDYDRFTALVQRNSASPKEMENVTLQYKSAAAALEAARQMLAEVNAQLSYTNVTAPFSGVVTQKFVDAGNMATPGAPVVQVEQKGGFRATAMVPESAIVSVKEGSDAEVSVKAAGIVVNGKVTEISRSSQVTGGQYMVKVSLPDSVGRHLYSGMYVNVVLQGISAAPATARAPLIPWSAIVRKAELTGIYTVGEGHQALLRWVRLGKTEGDKVEVLSGLAVSEEYILSADGELYNSVPVTVVDK